MSEFEAKCYMFSHMYIYNKFFFSEVENLVMN